MLNYLFDLIIILLLLRVCYTNHTVTENIRVVIYNQKQFHKSLMKWIGDTDEE